MSAEALRNALAAKHSLIGRRLLERHEVSFAAGSRPLPLRMPLRAMARHSSSPGNDAARPHRERRLVPGPGAPFAAGCARGRRLDRARAG